MRLAWGGRRRTRSKRRSAQRKRSALTRQVAGIPTTPAQFEHYVARVLRAHGWRNVRVAGGSGDLSADIFAVDPQGRTVAVQCKRYAVGTKVGSPVVQTVLGMATVHHRADRAMVVTTSSFTKSAEDLAARHGVELWDGFTLARIAGSRRFAGIASSLRWRNIRVVIGVMAIALYLLWPLDIGARTVHGHDHIATIGIVLFAIWLPIAVGVPLLAWSRRSKRS